MTIRIRHENSNDIEAIHDVTTSAFLHAPHTGHTEQFIVKALRQSGALTISLVAEEVPSGEIIGHVALSPVTITDGTSDWYGLGPISVHPDHQHQGIGSQLMNTAIEEVKKIAGKGCVLLGDPNYYQRFGFLPKAGLVLADVPSEYFQALLLKGDIPQGEVFYHEAFSATGE
ncbi:GNAT family N-acetyltransferase [Thalassotalea maritima]|uniref:GNAT family N-acetyltransferase n=1 Tax=Thalassotalea maritima TaxID=3242416 RepID=UPI0035279979